MHCVKIQLFTELWGNDLSVVSEKNLDVQTKRQTDNKKILERQNNNYGKTLKKGEKPKVSETKQFYTEN